MVSTISLLISSNELPQEANRLIIEHPQVSQFYLLPKIHKPDTHGRPIVTACNRVREDFLFCKWLPTETTEEHIFQLLNEFIEDNGIDWIKCVGVCTDGARTMTSQHRGVVARIREVAPEMNGRIATSTVRPLPSRKCLMIYLLNSVVSCIKARKMNSHLFCSTKQAHLSH
ncbi:ZMYM6 protein, partial [Atractosteus spatula]|nr:ZMYM6 protein [Atractosteus spatula]